MTDDGGTTDGSDVLTTDVGCEQDGVAGIWCPTVQDDVGGADSDDLSSRDLPCEDPSARDLFLTLALLLDDCSR